MYICTYVHTYIRTYVHAYTHTYVHPSVQTSMRTGNWSAHLYSVSFQDLSRCLEDEPAEAGLLEGSKGDTRKRERENPENTLKILCIYPFSWLSVSFTDPRCGYSLCTLLSVDDTWTSGTEQCQVSVNFQFPRGTPETCLLQWTTL